MNAARPASAPSRIAVADLARGLAIAMMFSYHFSFDLNYFGYIRVDFNNTPFWLAYRVVIVSLFLGVMGASLQFAHRDGIRWRAVRHRLLLLSACAGAVSLGSYLMFPRSYIYFGVLHFIDVASLLGLLFLGLRWANLLLGAAWVALGVLYANPLFDRPLLHWVGLMTFKPYTEDYVPMLPWFGVVLIGMAVGWLLLRRPPRWRAAGKGWAPLHWLGRHSLLLYLVHQPVFISVLYVVHRLWQA